MCAHHHLCGLRTHARTHARTGLARFVLVARTPDRTAAADVPALVPHSAREKELFEQGQVGAGPGAVRWRNRGGVLGQCRTQSGLQV